MIVYAVVTWQPLATAPAWWSYCTGVFLVVGIVSTLIASIALAGHRGASR